MNTVAKYLADIALADPKQYSIQHAGDIRQEIQKLKKSVYNSLISSGPLWSNLRLVVDGKDLHPSRFMNARVGDGLVFHGSPKADLIKGLLAEGATLVHNHLHKNCTEVAELQESLEYKLDARVWVQAYFTEAAETAFGMHRDDHNFFIIQLDGDKDWIIGDNKEKKTMEKGDVIFAPSETLHSVSALGHKSLHLTVAFDWINNSNGGSFLERSEFETFKKNKRFGSAIPGVYNKDDFDDLKFKFSSRVRPVVRVDDSEQQKLLLVSPASGEYLVPKSLETVIELLASNSYVSWHNILYMADKSQVADDLISSFVVFCLAKGIIYAEYI